MVAWTIDLPEETDRKLREYLSRHGGEDALPRLIEEAVRKPPQPTEYLDDVVKRVHAKNAHRSPEEIQKLIDEAVSEVRAAGS